MSCKKGKWCIEPASTDNYNVNVKVWQHFNDTKFLGQPSSLTFSTGTGSYNTKLICSGIRTLHLILPTCWLDIWKILFFSTMVYFIVRRTTFLKAEIKCCRVLLWEWDVTTVCSWMQCPVSLWDHDSCARGPTGKTGCALKDSPSGPSCATALPKHLHNRAPSHFTFHNHKAFENNPSDL